MTENDDFLNFLFGKKKRGRPKKRGKGRSKSGSKKGSKKKKPKTFYQAKKCRGNGRLVIVKVRKNKYCDGRPVTGRKKYKVRRLKSTARQDLNRLIRKRDGVGPKRRSSKRRSSFGTGPNFMPTSDFMSPYPYSVDSSAPWI